MFGTKKRAGESAFSCKAKKQRFRCPLAVLVSLDPDAIREISEVE